MSLRFRRAIPVAIAFAVPLVVLLASVRTSVGFWDTGDLQTVAWIAGIPYPTGFPGYVLIGWVWTHVLPFASVAARLNALSAVAVATAAAMLAALALVFEVAAPLAILAGWVFAFAHEVWARGAYADVHPLGFAVALGALLFAARWTMRGETRALAAAIVAAGAAVAIDNTSVLPLAGAAVAALGRPPPPRVVVGALALAAALVVAVYAYLPVRSAYVSAHRLDPTLRLGIAPGRPFWDDHHPAAAAGFRELVTGSEWTPEVALARVVTGRSIRAAARRYGPELARSVSDVGLLVALAGVVLLWMRAPAVAAGFVLAAALPALFAASYRAEADPDRYAFGLFALAAFGLAFCLDRALRRARPPWRLLVLGAALGLIAAIVGVELGSGRDILAGRDERDAARLGERVAAATRDGAVVVAPWDWATPLAYEAYVERRLGDRIVVCALPRDYAAQYRDWMRSRQVAIVSDGSPELLAYRTRLLAPGRPQIYEPIVP